MDKTRVLKIAGAILDSNQLENYLEKLASDHIIQKNSNKNTYPIERLKDNFKFITKTYEILNNHLKMGIHVHPAGEWLLDNYYIIEESVKSIEKELKLEKYINFVGIQNGIYSGEARIYVLASEIVAYTDGKIDAESLKRYLKAYQRKKNLNMDEIWNIGLFLQIALIEKIREICEKIYSSQIQKYRVENIVERLVEQKINLKFNLNSEYQAKNMEFGEMKYPFIEYMSYRLKKYGRKAGSYQLILEEQVKKMGTTVSDVIKKEHFDIALKKVSIGNSIKSIREIGRINFLEIFEEINGVEEILRKDPANVYAEMDYKSKNEYRNVIKELSSKTKISEIYIATKAYELASKAKNNLKNEKQTHIGYYLVSNGVNELFKELQINKKVLSTNLKINLYIFATWGLAAIFSVLIGINLIYNTKNILISLLIILFSYFPFVEINTKIINSIISKKIKTKLIPKMDFTNGVPKEYSTFVVIPTIIDSKEKVKKLIHKLEVFYLANKSENIYFALLGDCTSGKNQKEDFDSDLINCGNQEIKKLNLKYKNNEFPKFHFIYRKRTWNNGEGCYLGWERKRGLLNQFNEYLLGNEKNVFYANTIEEELNNNKKLPKIKYILTLDSDTNLVLESGLQLIGAMAHILNRPERDKEKNIIIDGYGIMQPRVGVDLISGNKSLYSKIFAGLPGTDSYSSAVSNVYQDVFYEGIFTGKGIYDLEEYSIVLKNQIPENTVLSHDLLEGNYLRCAYISDILLLDGFPFKYNSNMSRIHRWIRGDWQIISWLKSSIINSTRTKQINPLNKISKFKILDNLRRSLIEVSILSGLFLIGLVSICYKINLWWILLFFILSIFISTIIDVILKKERTPKEKGFTPFIRGIKASFIGEIINFMCLPHRAYISINAIIKALYRMYISKKNLLEWTTSEEAEKNAKTDLNSYIKIMWPNYIAGIIAIYFSLRNISIALNITNILFALIWFSAPIIMFYLSKEIIENKIKLNIKDENFVKDIALRTWNYFETYLNEENNFLPPDNYQEDRKEKVVDRTSSTNIGLVLLCVISSYDLGYISQEKAINYLEKILNTIENMDKWHGHLYNWYNIKSLKPLYPKYVSTVDSGNFIGYLFTLKQFLIDLIDRGILKENKLLKIVDKIINETDFSYLYDNKKGIFSIGFNVEENKLTDSYYDLLATEARQASIVAIAKKDVPSKHWNNLSRTLTSLNGYKGLVSWAGTAFEYLMPNINIRKYPGSLLDESCKFLIMSQKEYSKKLNIPWGISEAAFNLKDLNSNYQYKSFGIPWLGLKRGLADELNITPYASILAINEDTKSVIENLRKLEKEGMYSKFGFYEALDYTQDRLAYGEKNAIVKTYMAHHQALILLAINNLMNNNILQKRFMNNAEIEAIDVLLQERMPTDVVITKEKKEKINKIKYKDFQQYSKRIYSKLNTEINNCNLIASDKYSICTKENGEGFSKYKDILVNKFKQTDDYNQGIFFYLKNIKTRKVWTATPDKNITRDEKFKIEFSPDMTKFVKEIDNIKTNLKIMACPNEAVEIRQIEIINEGNSEEKIEISSAFEPVLSKKEQEYAHPAFNNLFLKYDFEKNSDLLLIKRNKRGNQEDIYCGVCLYTENNTIGDLEFEIDKQKFMGRGNYGIPLMVEKSIPFSNMIGAVTDPIVALRKTVKINPGEKIKLNLIITVSEKKEEVIKYINNYRSLEKIERTFELSKAKVDEENRYLGINGKEIDKYQKLLSFIIFQNPTRKFYLKNLHKKQYSQSDLWKYGISGDLPILLVNIRDVNDIDIIKDLLKAYEYFQIKNIKMDLIIYNEEESVYEKYVYDAIISEIQNKQLMYRMNTNGGIFILNSAEIADKELFLWSANLIINAKDGNLENILNYLNEDYKESIKNIGEQAKKSIISENKIKLTSDFHSENLLYYNEFGGFTKDGKEYKIKVNRDFRTPTVWANVLANENFGTIVTENMSGFTWSENSRLNRLSSWNNDPVMDVPSEVIYIKDNDIGKAWSLGLNPMPDENDYVITYGFGYANYQHRNDGLLQDVDIYVPTNDNIKINIIKLKNVENKKKNLKLIYYIKPVLGEDELSTNSFLNLKYKDQENLLYMRNMFTNDFKDNICYVSCSEKICSFTGSRKSFFGKGNFSNPEALNKVGLDFENSLGQTPCIAIQINITLDAYENKDISLMFGCGKFIDEIKQIAKKYSNISKCYEELTKVKSEWNKKIGAVKVETPLESLNIMLNGWAVYQTLCCRIWARSGYYQSGGAFGFRDQLQDSMGLKYVDSDYMKKQILIHAKHQFIEGDVEHWWHEQTNKGIRTKFSDDLLWLPYVTAEYINFTGDYSILDIKQRYISGNLLDENTDEIYDTHPEIELEESIYTHCIRAIQKGINLGEHGIPKIGTGDWNDGFSTVGNKGKGESVWLGFFLYEVLERFIPICKKRGDEYLADKWQKLQQNLKKSLNSICWDGRWYRRAYTDDGKWIGSSENEEAKIDNIAQTWSIISNVGDNDKKFICMDSLDKYLIDRENEIIKLLTPAFEKSNFEPGYIKSYMPGIRENGGQYTHECCC